MGKISLNVGRRQMGSIDNASVPEQAKKQNEELTAAKSAGMHFIAAAVTGVLMLFGSATPTLAENGADTCDHTTHPHGCTDPNDAAAVAKELTNPAGSLASLTFKNQFRWYDGNLPGAGSQSNYSVLFQPAFPFPIGTTSTGGKANFFARPAIPFVVDQPTFGPGGFNGVTALGDIGFDLAYGVTETNGLIWIAGLTGTLPTATDSRVAGKQLRLGPEAFVGQSFDWGLVGIFPSHQWNVAGWSNTYHSTTQIQPFLNINLPDAWQISSQPIITYDWTSDQWTVPINVQLAKTVQIGKLPVRFQLEADYYVARNNAFADEWLIGLNVTPVVPNFINNWIRGN